MTESTDPLDDMDVQHIKLTDGNEIIGYINSTDKAIILMERPMILNLAMTTNGNDTYYFTKYFPFAKSNIVKINSRNVVSASEVRSDIKEKYIQAALKSDKFRHITPEDQDLDTDTDLTDENMDLNFMEPASKKIH
jgi:hypothetical protein